MKKVRIVGQPEIVAPVVAATPLPMPAFSFDQWWLMVSASRELRADLKDAIRKHFEAKGFMKSKKFDDGLKDFGF